MATPVAGRKKRKPVVADVAAALARQDARVGETISLRAIRRAFYGLGGAQAAQIREPGDEFRFAIKHLVEITDPKAFEKAEYADGTPKRSIMIGDKSYELPSWCVDPSVPSAFDEEEFDEEDEDAAPAGHNMDVI